MSFIPLKKCGNKNMLQVGKGKGRELMELGKEYLKTEYLKDVII